MTTRSQKRRLRADNTPATAMSLCPKNGSSTILSLTDKCLKHDDRLSPISDPILLYIVSTLYVRQKVLSTACFCSISASTCSLLHKGDGLTSSRRTCCVSRKKFRWQMSGIEWEDVRICHAYVCMYVCTYVRTYVRTYLCVCFTMNVCLSAFQLQRVQTAGLGLPMESARIHNRGATKQPVKAAQIATQPRACLLHP